MGWHFLVKLQNNDFPLFLPLSSCSVGSQLPFCELLHEEAGGSGRNWCLWPEPNGVLKSATCRVEWHGNGPSLSWALGWQQPHWQGDYILGRDTWARNFQQGAPGTLAHSNHEIISSYYFKPLGLGWFVMQHEVTNTPHENTRYGSRKSLPFSLVKNFFLY